MTLSSIKIVARFRRFLHCLTHLHRAIDGYDEVLAKPNRFGLKTMYKHTEMACECGKSYWKRWEERSDPS